MDNPLNRPCQITVTIHEHLDGEYGVAKCGTCGKEFPARQVGSATHDEAKEGMAKIAQYQCNEDRENWHG